MRHTWTLLCAKVLSLLLLAGITGCATCHSDGVELPKTSLEIRRETISNACRITCGESTGSGVLASENIAITANHVINDYLLGGEISLEIPGDQVSSGWVIVYVSYEYDIAIIRRPHSKGPGRVRWSGWSDSLTIGQRVFAAGFPWGVGPILTTGYLSRITDRDYFWISTNALPGSSGSAIYSMDGRVIGILVRGLVAGGHWSQFTFHAVPVSLVAKELSDSGI